MVAVIGHRRGLEHLTISFRRGALLNRLRVRLPRVRVRRLPLTRWRRVTRKLAFLVDPAKRELLPWAWPKHPQIRKP
jgi:hypothetical protein